MMKLLRGGILLGLALIGVWCGYVVYDLIYNLLDFQIGAYKVLLQTGEQLGEVKDSLGGVLDQAASLFGVSVGDFDTDGSASDIAHKTQAFARKIQMVSGLIGVLVGYWVRKTLFGIIFGFDTLVTKMRQFVLGRGQSE